MTKIGFDRNALPETRQSLPDFSPKLVREILKVIAPGSTRLGLPAAQARWLSYVAARAISKQPTYRGVILEYLGIEPASNNLLGDLSIGEMSACYEALIATADAESRKQAGQFFTPDDAARFMAERTLSFPAGVWLDPCCGVGNLSWHLINVQADPEQFMRDSLVLIDRDPVALKTAVTTLASEFGSEGQLTSFTMLAGRSLTQDFLEVAEVPEHDFMLCNPPYAGAPKRSDFDTGESRDLYAYFWERAVKTSRGYVFVTPASYTSAPKYASLRRLLEKSTRGGRVFVFDNVPDTLFRGFKYGSDNTSKTNFVRAAITISAPSDSDWQMTPILRWQAPERRTMFAECHRTLRSRRIGPHGEWAKIGPGMQDAWDLLSNEPVKLSALLADTKTEFKLDVALTPRYFISASFRDLQRGSKATLYFQNIADRDRAAIVLNSSVPYFWWRSLDGGVTLPKRVLLSTPVPSVKADGTLLVEMLRESEQLNVVTKMNAGIANENVKHPPALIEELNRAVFPGVPDLRLLYSNAMFPLPDGL